MLDEKQVKKNRRMLVVLMMVFLLPPLLAWIIFKGGDSWYPEGTTNAGTLVHPARPLPEGITLQRGDQALTADYLNQAWTLLYIDSADCDDACDEKLFNTRQIRLAMGEESNRLQRLFLYHDAENPERLTELAQKYPKLAIAALPGAWLDSFRIDDQDPKTAGRTYVVDGRGNLMMFYRVDQPPNNMLRDLRKLLK